MVVIMTVCLISICPADYELPEGSDYLTALHFFSKVITKPDSLLVPDKCLLKS
jgi:hypothetical protein